MNTIRNASLKIGALLVGALVLLVAAPMVVHNPSALLTMFGGLGLAGTVAYNYINPGSGTVPATVAQANKQYSQTCEIGMADGDTLATFTHNWGMSTAANALDQPWIIAWAKNAGTAAPNLTFALNTNYVQVFKAAASGTGNTTVVVLLRPNTIIS